MRGFNKCWVNKLLKFKNMPGCLIKEIRHIYNTLYVERIQTYYYDHTLYSVMGSGQMKARANHMFCSGRHVLLLKVVIPI